MLLQRRASTAAAMERGSVGQTFLSALRWHLRRPMAPQMTPGSTLRHPVRRPCALEPAVSAVYWGAHGLRTLPPGTACSTSRLFRSLLMRRLCNVNWDSFRQSAGTKCGDEVYPTKRGDKVCGQSVSAEHPLKPSHNLNLNRHATRLLLCFRQSYRQSSRQSGGILSLHRASVSGACPLSPFPLPPMPRRRRGSRRGKRAGRRRCTGSARSRRPRRSRPRRPV